MERSGIGGGSISAFKDSAMDLYRTIVPTMRRCSSFKSAWRPEAAERRALQQQAENLKWQQDMYLRLVNLQGRCREGLVDEDDVASFRQKILDRVVVCFDGGECPGVTRDKLLFLQELLFSRCISEEEYHSVKKPLLYRLGDQGAEIDARDIIFSTAAPTSAPSTPVERKVPETPGVCSKATEAVTGVKANNGKSPSKSPAKQFLQAVSRLKHGGRKAGKEKVKVPHALDFVRPKDCPVRDPPTALESPGTPKVGFSDQCDSPLFHSPTSSVDSSDKRPYVVHHRDKFSVTTLPAERTTPGSAKSTAPAHKSPLSDESRVKAAEDVHAGAGDKEAKATPKKAWRLDLLRPPKIVTGRQETPTEKPKAAAPDNSLGILSPRRAPKVTPDTVKLKKVHGKASTDFFIDKVLGENIKQELERIRKEMNRSSTTQAFTNEQIEAISTRLPADKSELLRFFPKSWCDRYGDIVLDVVHKEFKGHIKDMEASRRTAKRVTPAKQGENDENSSSTINTDGTTLSKASSAAPKVSVTRCFTTADNNNNDLDARSTNQGPVRTPRRKPLRTAEEYERELDGKLFAEIQKLPHGRATPIRV